MDAPPNLIVLSGTESRLPPERCLQWSMSVRADSEELSIAAGVTIKLSPEVNERQGAGEAGEGALAPFKDFRVRLRMGIPMGRVGDSYCV